VLGDLGQVDARIAISRRALLLAVALCALVGGRSAWAGCNADVIAVDPALGDTLVPAFVCRGQGQTFYAADTLLTAITVWNLPRNYLDYLPRRLFVVGVVGGMPNPRDIIYGPRDLVVLEADSLNPIPYRYEFDPPILFPGVGTYAFVILTDREIAGFNLMADSKNPYAEGQDCEMGPVYACEAPGGPRCYAHPDFDLCFAVELCRDVMNATQRRSWGRLKLIYRGPP
jgi:hypothetical protein